eukprot:jgi/Mesvir1/15117/Mv14757-RA.1
MDLTWGKDGDSVKSPDVKTLLRTPSMNMDMSMSLDSPSSSTHYKGKNSMIQLKKQSVDALGVTRQQANAIRVIKVFIGTVVATMCITALSLPIVFYYIRVNVRGCEYVVDAMWELKWYRMFNQCIMGWDTASKMDATVWRRLWYTGFSKLITEMCAVLLPIAYAFGELYGLRTLLTRSDKFIFFLQHTFMAAIFIWAAVHGVSRMGYFFWPPVYMTLLVCMIMITYRILRIDRVREKKHFVGFLLIFIGAKVAMEVLQRSRLPYLFAGTTPEVYRTVYRLVLHPAIWGGGLMCLRMAIRTLGPTIRPGYQLFAMAYLQMNAALVGRFLLVNMDDLGNILLINTLLALWEGAARLNARDPDLVFIKLFYGFKRAELMAASSSSRQMRSMTVFMSMVTEYSATVFAGALILFAGISGAPGVAPIKSHVVKSIFIQLVTNGAIDLFALGVESKYHGINHMGTFFRFFAKGQRRESVILGLKLLLVFFLCQVIVSRNIILMFCPRHYDGEMLFGQCPTYLLREYEPS